MAKHLISIRISDATQDKLDYLAERHGTQTEAVAVAIDRLYQAEKRPKERTMNAVAVYTDQQWNYETTLEEREAILREAMENEQRVWLHADGSMAIADEVEMAEYAARFNDDDWVDHSEDAFYGL